MVRSFNEQSRVDEVLKRVDVAGRRVLVTGVSAGLGVETARSLIARGAIVVGTARDRAKAERAIGPRRGAFELLEMDLASLASVRSCAEILLARGLPFDVVICNAGVMACPRGLTADGFETQFATNHLGHFLLVNRLLPLLREGSRVVVLSSDGHRFADIDLDDPNFERTAYEPFVAYGRSKTANALFAAAFDRRHRGRGIRAVSVHPGRIRTELARYLPAEQQDVPAFGWKTIPQGAATTAWASFVADPDEIGGRYVADCRIANLAPHALDAAHAEALWAKSEAMVGERF